MFTLTPGKLYVVNPTYPCFRIQGYFAMKDPMRWQGFPEWGRVFEGDILLYTRKYTYTIKAAGGVEERYWTYEFLFRNRIVSFTHTLQKPLDYILKEANQRGLEK